MKMLTQTVTYRGEIVNRDTFKERNDGTFTPYKLSNEINNIENLFGIIVLNLVCIMLLQYYVTYFIF